MDKIKKLLQKISTEATVGFDSCFFIYQFQNHPKYTSLCAAITDLLEKGEIEGTTSSIAISEILVRPLKLNLTEVVFLLDQTLQEIPHLTIVPVDYPVAKIAAQVRARYGLRLPDALHVASAFFSGAKIFITNDQRLKSIKTPKVLCLSDYID